jgi:hypothetical protein
MAFLIFIFATFGMVEIIIQGLPTAPIRRAFLKNEVGAEFIRCPLCLGFWVGIILGFWLLPLEVPWYLGAFFNGLIGSGASYFLHNLVTLPDFGEDEDENRH